VTTSTVPVLDSTAITGPAFDGYAAISPEDGAAEWVEVCSISKILPDTGVCVLVDDNQIAVFHLEGGEVYAIGNLDPFSNAAVLSRGIVGDSGGIPKVASPVYKQSFDLRSGSCLDDVSVRIPAYQARVIGGIVQVRASPTEGGDHACPSTPGAASHDPRGGERSSSS
jgi:nitrite reductase (NADH) small subunit